MLPSVQSTVHAEEDESCRVEGSGSVSLWVETCRADRLADLAVLELLAVDGAPAGFAVEPLVEEYNGSRGAVRRTGAYIAGHDGGSGRKASLASSVARSWWARASVLLGVLRASARAGLCMRSIFMRLSCVWQAV